MTTSSDHRGGKRRLPPTVVGLGVVSFLTDVGSEMLFPLLPLFLTQELKATPAFLGIIEGTADSVASLLKLVSGYIADRMPRRKPLVIIGYLLAAVARPLVAITTAAWQVLAIRVTDRVGKGIRSSPRDAMIADVARDGDAGRAFGFHQAMDHDGAVVGPLVATALLSAGFYLRTVFLWAAVPAILALLVVLGLKETPRITPPKPTTGSAPAAPLPSPAKSLFGVIGLFALGNSSDAFLLLRANTLGIAPAAIPALWSVLHVSKVLSSYAGGWASDRIPRTWLIGSGWVVFAGVYLGLAYTTSASVAWLLFIVYGAYYGLTEPTEKALIRDLVPAESLGRAFGVYNFIVGIAALPAGILIGFLWKSYGPTVALATGATFALVSAMALAVWSLRHSHGRRKDS